MILQSDPDCLVFTKIIPFLWEFQIFLLLNVLFNVRASPSAEPTATHLLRKPCALRTCAVIAVNTNLPAISQ